LTVKDTQGQPSLAGDEQQMCKERLYVGKAEKAKRNKKKKGAVGGRNGEVLKRGKGGHKAWHTAVGWREKNRNVVQTENWRSI